MRVLLISHLITFLQLCGPLYMITLSGMFDRQLQDYIHSNSGVTFGTRETQSLIWTGS